MFGLYFHGKVREIMVTSDTITVGEISTIVGDIQNTVISITDTPLETTFTGKVKIVDVDSSDCETIDLLRTLKEQKMQIEALSEMISEMVQKKDFNIEWDLDKRIEQKKFLNKLRGN